METLKQWSDKMSKSKKELIKSISTSLVKYGYTVYIAKTGEYGFYTDGVRAVSFGGWWSYSIDFNGNYESKSRCTGWQIAKELIQISEEEAKAFINCCAPMWATNGESVKLTTPEQYLAKYGKSSGYVKFDDFYK